MGKSKYESKAMMLRYQDLPVRDITAEQHELLSIQHDLTHKYKYLPKMVAIAEILKICLPAVSLRFKGLEKKGINYVFSYCPYCGKKL